MQRSRLLLATCLSFGFAVILGHVLPADAAGQAPVRTAATAPRGPSEAIVPFTIRVPDAVLTDLKERLARTRFPAEITGSGWTQGADLAYMKELVAYWRDRFDWRAQERRLNQFEQFKTNIDGVEIHFIHRKSKEPGALPLIISHGWPGSVAEFTKII